MNSTNTHYKTYQAPAQLLKGKVILVTGAGNGIGATAAKTFAQHGATVILADRSVSALEQVYDEIIGNGDSQPAIYPIDFKGATPQNYIELAQTLDKEFGQLDGLLHNAAHLGNLAPIELYDAELWFATFQINIHAPFFLTQACLPLLKSANHASIVYTIDEVALQSRAYWGAYAASKAAVQNLMQTLSHELSESTSVRVNSIDPGIVKTSMRARAFPGEDPNSIATADTIMPTYLYVMGDESLPENGQTFYAQ